MAIQAPPSADGGSRNVDKLYGDGVNKETIRAATPSASPSGPPPQGAGPIPPPPGSLGALTAPSGRPGEPLTAGLSLGEGPGPSEFGQNGGGDDALWELRALAERFPSRDLARIIALAESRM